VVNLKKKQEIILRYFRDGASMRRISRETGISRDTVAKYIAEYSSQKEELRHLSGGSPAELIESIVEEPSYDSSTRKKRKLTPEMIGRVKRCLSENKQKCSQGQHKQQMKKIDIHHCLRSEGYDIGYSSICVLVNELERKPVEGFIKQKYEYGQVCEFDWGEVKVFLEGALKKLQMAVFTTAKGNYRYARLFVKQNTASFQQAHAFFFDHIGGVYHELVYDNMRVAVKKFVGPTEKEATRGLLSLSLYYHFGFRFCTVRRGNEKGHVEKSVEYVRRKAFCVRDEFASVDEANVHLLDVCERLNALPQVGQQHQSAQKILERERGYLLPVGPMFECGELRESRVDKYSTISVDTCHYSVPEDYVGQLISVRLYPDRIVCYADGKQRCTHQRRHGFHEWFIQLEHYLHSLRRKPGALSGSVAFKQSDGRLQALYHRYYQNRAKDFIELLLYMREHDKRIEEIEHAITQLNQIGLYEIRTDTIKLVLAKDVQPSPPGEPGEIARSALRQLTLLAGLIPEQKTLQGEVLV
jgi:transposase